MIPQNRNVPILVASQALGTSGVAMVILLGGIIGADLAPSPSWATLPVSIMVVGGAVFALPAGAIMRRIGRRLGFAGATVMAALAALLGAYAIAQGSFPLFCLATLLVGANGAFVQQYRFAASESVDQAHAGRAVSLVLLGGVAAGFLGPQMAATTRDWLPAGTYVGSFVSMAGLYLVVAVLLAFMAEVGPRGSEASGTERPLASLFLQPTFLMALLAGAVAYGVMTFTMTSTPIYMHRTHGFSLQDTAWVIQSHVMAMFLPSLFSGFVLERLGLARMMTAGVVFLLACVGLAVVSQDLLHFWGALVLLGVGWNFLFVGATVLLTHSYLPQERFKAQATNDFVVFCIQAFTALSAGTVLFYANWTILNAVNLPFLLATLAAIWLLRARVATLRSPS